MNRRNLGTVVVAVLLLAALIAGLLGARSCSSGSGEQPGDTLATLIGEPLTSVPDSAGGAPTAAVEATLQEVIDGDTISVRLADGSMEKVRYIGIDAPEISHSGSAGEFLDDEATAHNAELLAAGRLRLETDVEERDQYGRLLAYVWVGEVFVNERMVADGYARAHNYPPNLTRQRQLWAANDAAREAGLGIWQESQD